MHVNDFLFFKLFFSTNFSCFKYLHDSIGDLWTNPITGD